MALRIRPAPAAYKPLLRALLTDCLLELAAYGEVDLAYPYLDAYWDQGERRWPYLCWHGNVVAGFALVNSHSPSGLGTDFAMAEFYIAPAERRSGAGLLGASEIIRMHPGSWELSVMTHNAPAQRFWLKVMAASGASGLERIEHGAETIYRFNIG